MKTAKPYIQPAIQTYEVAEILEGPAIASGEQQFDPTQAIKAKEADISWDDIDANE